MPGRVFIPMQEDFELLIDALITGRLSREQRSELRELLEQPAYENALKARLDKELASGRLVPQESDPLYEVIYQRILSNVEEKTLAPVRTIHSNLQRVRKYLRVAAAITFAIAGIATFWLITQQKNTPMTQAQRLENQLAPGKTGAVLTLSDGRTILLDTARNGLLAKGFTKGSDLLTIEETEIEYATVSTPKGRTQSIILSDGTAVWLNAGSSITFPTKFSGNKREVSMSGEVYFEVAKNEQKHFFVQSPGDLIEVKGTHFNINAYESGIVKTTLLEGSVSVTHNPTKEGTGAVSKMLKPGDQFDGKQITEPDLEEVMAWKNGLFRFNATNIKTIMAEVERWYDVEVVYEGDVSGLDFSGGVPRSGNVAILLQKLELTKSVEFRIEGRKIFVKELKTD